MLNKTFLIVFLFSIAGHSVAQEEEAEENPPSQASAEAREEQTQEELIKECESRLKKLRDEEQVDRREERSSGRRDDDPCGDLAIEASTDDFVPSEDISADNSISFPVDI
ncbi:MAG: hypothetical protein AAF438_18310 [Pseudomonadota bacterium]